MTNKRKFKNVLDLARGIAEDRKFVDDLSSHLNERRISHGLAVIRGCKGMTQQEVADKLGWTQSRVSKLEHSVDDKLNFGDIIKYGQAIGVRFEMTVMDKDMTAAEQIKHQAFRIKELADRLAALAGDDERIARGISNFFAEAAVNLLGMLHDSAAKLPLPSTDLEFAMTIAGCGEESRSASSGRSGHEKDAEPLRSH